MKGRRALKGVAQFRDDGDHWYWFAAVHENCDGFAHRRCRVDQMFVSKIRFETKQEAYKAMLAAKIHLTTGAEVTNWESTSS